MGAIVADYVPRALMKPLPKANRFLGVGQLIGRIRRFFAAFFSRLMRTSFAHRIFTPFIAPAQLWLYRVTGGRVQFSAILVPSLVLVTTGAKSGLRRETPLMCWPRPDGSYLVCGSNWGRPDHPAWTANLLAHPDTEIVVRRRNIPVHATLLSGADRVAAWPILEAQWPGYREYERKAGRDIRIFRLVPR
jgi:deazaflavin-dependent oxidoreductase (nitroreductase family)